MTNVYKFTRFWQIAGITSCFGLSIGILLPLFLVDKDSSFYSVFSWLSAIMFIVSLVFTFEATTGKIVTSPSGIEWFTIGTRVQIPWDMVERIDSRGFGYLSLVFKGAIYKNSLGKSILHLLGSDNKIELTSYVRDPRTSKLISDIMQYAPSIKSHGFGYTKNS